MAFHVEFYRYSMEFHGTPWKSMELHGIPWNSMELHEYSMELHGYFDPWILRISHELTDETSFGVGNKYVHLNWSLNFSGQENLFFLSFFVFFFIILLFYYFKRCCDNPFYGRKKLELLFASFWSLIRNEPIYINALKTLEGFRRGTTQICLESEDMGRGLRKSSKVIRGDHFREVTLKGGITLFSPKSSPVPRAINNDRALIKSCEQIEPSFAFLSDEEIKKRRLCLNKVKPFKPSHLMIKLLD